MMQDQDTKAPGTVSAENLLISGDFIHREQARARFEITPNGQKIVLAERFR